jgi:AmmeMemoRadiSam system protein B
MMTGTIKASPKIRRAAVAGMFYPSGSDELITDIENLFFEVHPTPLDGLVFGLVVPHAGYMYSGLTAAYGYSLLAGKKFDTVVVISPSHREYFEGISIYSGSAYQTPLGALTVDEELRETIVNNETLIFPNESGHGSEHAVEVHLPFLQYLRCTQKFLPVVMGDQRKEFCLLLAARLAQALKGRSALVIASSDLSHYHPYREANKLDQTICDDIASFNPEKLTDDLDTERGEMCGGGPVIAMLHATRLLGATRAKILHHCNSGDVTGDRDAVVGYLSAAIYQQN